jgi:hypothetical protein
VGGDGQGRPARFLAEDGRVGRVGAEGFLDDGDGAFEQRSG